MSEYIRNPATGRNVLRSGKIGKRLIKEAEELRSRYEVDNNEVDEGEPEPEQEAEPEPESCNICTNEECAGIKKCKRCNFYAGKRCIKKWYDQVGSKSCPGCRHNFLTGTKIKNRNQNNDGLIDDIDFSYGLTVFAGRLVANPPRNGHIMEDVINLVMNMLIEEVSNHDNASQFV